MNKKIIIGLILALSISMVGCNDKKETSSKGDTNVSQEDSSKDNEEHEDNKEDGVVDTTVKISDEKMVEIYETALPEIRELYEGICPEPLVEQYGDGPDPNQLTRIKYRNYDNTTVGEAAIAIYILMYNNDNSVMDISGTVDLNYDVSKIVTEGFKFEESIFCPIVEALIGSDHDYSEVNEQIQKYYQGEDVDSMVKFYDGYFGFSIDCQDDGLYFGYTYFNERSE